MIPRVNSKARSYFEILFSPQRKMILFGLGAASALLFSIVVVLEAGAPRSSFGKSGADKADIEVTYPTEQPVVIKTGHEFRLVKAKGALNIGYYYVDDGIDPVNYTINISDASGKLLYTIHGAVAAPDTYGFTLSQTEATVTAYDDKWLDLAPGRYMLSIESGHGVSYQVIQKFKYLSLEAGVGFIGVLTMLGLILVMYAGYKTWRRENGPALPIMGPVVHPAQAACNPPLYPVPFYQPGNNRVQGMLERDGYEVAGYYCARCGNVIQNPVVQNVITCENCGEREYVG